MGQSQSPPKFSAKPGSSLFQNNLAVKMKDKQFKKHISSHGFVRKSNIRNVKGSSLSKSSNSQNNSSNNSNLKVNKQSDPKKKQKKSINTAINGQNIQNFQLSDIQQSQAQYEDDQTKRNNKLSEQKRIENRINQQRMSISMRNSLHSSSHNHNKKLQDSFKYIQDVKKYQNTKVNELKPVKSINQVISGNSSQNDQNNQILFIQSKNASSSHKSNSNLSSHAFKSNPSYKEYKSSYVEYKADLGNNFNFIRDNPLTVKQNQISTNNNQRLSYRPENQSQKIKQSTKNFKGKQYQKQKQQRKIQAQLNEVYVHIQKELGPKNQSSLQQKTKIIISRNSIQQKISRSNKFKRQQPNDNENKTISKINKYHTNNQKNQDQVTIRSNKLSRSSKNKNKEDNLFASNRKVFASQVQVESSYVSSPQNYLRQESVENNHHNINKLINSKSFQSDFIKPQNLPNNRANQVSHLSESNCFENRHAKDQRQSLCQRKSVKNHSKMRDSAFQKMIKKSQQMIQLKKQRQSKINGSQLSVSSKFNIENKQKSQRKDLQLSQVRSQQNFQRKPSKINLKSSSFSNQKNSSIIKSKNSSKIKQPKQQLSRRSRSKQKSHIRNDSKIKVKTSRQQKQRYASSRNQYNQQQNFKNTQQSYFNQNQNLKDFVQTQFQLHSNPKKTQSKLKNQIHNMMNKSSEYEINHNKKKQQTSDYLLQNNKKVNKVTSATKLYVFSEEMTYSLKENNLEKTRVNLIKVEEKQKRQKQIEANKQERNNEKKQNKSKKSPQKELSHNKRESIKQKNNYLQKDIQKNHFFNQYNSKKNPQPSDKKTMKIIKFSELQPNPIDIISNEKLIQTTSAKNYPYSGSGIENEAQSKLKQKQSQKHKTKDYQKQYIKKIDENLKKEINVQSRKSLKQNQRSRDYQIFLQELQNLKRIKQIQRNLIQQNLSNMKKSNSHGKISLFDLNKQIINQQITLKIQRMKKLKQLNKLTKKLDPTLLIKTKQTQFLQDQYKRAVQQQRRSYQKDKKKLRKEQKYLQKKQQSSLQKLLQTENYFNTTKQFQSLSYLNEENNLKQYLSSNLVKSSQDFFKSKNPNIHSYSQQYLSLSTSQNKQKQIPKKSLEKKMKVLQLASIPQSPQIKFIPQQYAKSRDSIIKIKQLQKSASRIIQLNKSRLSKTMKNMTHSLDHTLQAKYHSRKQATSLQKTITPKKALIVF